MHEARRSLSFLVPGSLDDIELLSWSRKLVSDGFGAHAELVKGLWDNSYMGNLFQVIMSCFV